MTHKVLKSCRNKMATLPHEHDVCDVQGASSLYIKTWWQSCIYVYIYIYLVFPNGGMVGIPLPDKNLFILPLPTEFLFPPTKSQFNPIKKTSFLSAVIAPVPFLFYFHTLSKHRSC